MLKDSSVIGTDHGKLSLEEMAWSKVQDKEDYESKYRSSNLAALTS